RFTGMFRNPLINTAGAGAAIVTGGGGTSIFVPGAQSLFNSGSEYMARFDYLKRRIDFGMLYYRKTDIGTNGPDILKLYTNLYQGIAKYPFDKVKSVRLYAGVRSDRYVTKAIDDISMKTPDIKQMYALLRAEYVYDNAIAKATNIMNGLRYKVYFDVNSQINDVRIPGMGRQSFNFGFDGRYYYPIYRNFIWAGRVAGDFSWGDQKVLYYLGGVDGWLLPKADQG